jgi:hypothetical protein
MDWRVPLSLAVLLLDDLAMRQANTTSAWDANLSPGEKFSLRNLARLTHGEVLRTPGKNPVRTRAIMNRLVNMGLAEEPSPHAWRPTFLGRRVARMIGLERMDALPYS